MFELGKREWLVFVAVMLFLLRVFLPDRIPGLLEKPAVFAERSGQKSKRSFPFGKILDVTAALLLTNHAADQERGDRLG